MVNEHSDNKEQFWMDARTREFQVGGIMVICKLLLVQNGAVVTAAASKESELGTAIHH